LFNKFIYTYLYVDEGLVSEMVDVYIYPECIQIEHGSQVVVEYECHYDTQMNKLKTVKSEIAFWRSSVSRQLFIFSIELYRIVVFTSFRRRFARRDQTQQLSFQFMKS
jgi:hypothetical protein